MNKKFIAVLATLSLGVILTGCGSTLQTLDPIVDNKVDRDFPVLQGMPFSKNHTPYSASLVCLAEDAATNTQFMNQYRHSIAVGHIKDLTGKYDYENGGYKITQGASDMMVSALFKTGAFRIVERNNMEITELERSLASQQLVREFDLNDNQRVRDVTAGEVIGSDYKIVGSINELNYNISSGGGEISVGGAGIGARSYVADVGIDLFLVDTTTTQVIAYISVKKQLVGVEMKAGVFRFFNKELWDVSLGAKKQEPVQLAVRSAIEDAAYEFTAKLYGTPPSSCQTLKDSADGI